MLGTIVCTVAAITLIVGGTALAAARHRNCRPRPRANLSGCVYNHRNLTRANFTSSNLTGARITNSLLKRARFARARLTGLRSGGDRGRRVRLPARWSLTGGYVLGPAANLAGANLARANLTGRQLSDITLTGANLTGATIAGTNFSGAAFTGLAGTGVIGTAAALPNGWTQRAGDLVGPSANLIGATLTGADLTQVNLSHADLNGATLTGATLNEAALIGASLRGAHLSQLAATQVDLTGADLTGATLEGDQLTEAQLSSANLTGASLTGAQLTAAALQGATLTGADLTNVSSGSLTGTPASLPANWEITGGTLIGPGAALTGANLSQADLTGADLAKAQLSGADLAKANVSAANLSGAQLSGANLSGANLANATIASANIDSAQLVGANLSGTTVAATSGTPATVPAGWSMSNGTLTQVSSSIAGTTYLQHGDWLESPNGSYTVDMQHDGNFVEYQGGTAIWATGTSGADFSVMQSDCNFVVYNSSNTAIYTTGTGGDPNAGCTFAVANDGSLSVTTGSGTVRWERYANGTIFTHRITMTQNAGLYNGTSTSSGQTDTIPTGQSPDYVCWTTGQVVNNVDVWFYVLWDNKAGYYPSGDDSSVYSVDSRISIDYGIPRCGSVPTTFTPPSNGSTGQTGPATIKAPIAVTTAVNLRPGPSTSSGSPLTTMPPGTSPGFLCWTTGQVISSIDVWFKVYWAGVTGYYASALDNSSYTTDGQITSKYGIPSCGGSTGGGSGGSQPSGSGGNTATEAAAASWARNQTGSTAWEYLCLSFVYQAWETAGVSRGTLNAIAGYTPNGNTYPIDEWRYWAGGHPPGGIWHSGFDPAPPPGAMIFYSNKLGDEDSHATISLGGGSMISPGTRGVTGPASVTYNDFATMLGWWMPK